LLKGGSFALNNHSELTIFEAHMNQTQIPDAALLLASGCHHCPIVLDALNELVKQGKLGRLEVTNANIHPEMAQEVGTQSVPWTRIGPFEFEGALTPKEITIWTQKATHNQGVSDYFVACLETKRSDKVLTWLDQRPEHLVDLLNLLASDETPMGVRIGIGVIVEQLQGDARLVKALPALLALSESPQANIRADAAHYLGLTHAPEAKLRLDALLEDDHPDVRDIAADALKLVTINKDTLKKPRD
jgi:thiol-disulfide isomerase/thioredoxin